MIANVYASLPTCLILTSEEGWYLFKCRVKLPVASPLKTLNATRQSLYFTLFLSERNCNFLLILENIDRSNVWSKYKKLNCRNSLDLLQGAKFLEIYTIFRVPPDQGKSGKIRKFDILGKSSGKIRKFYQNVKKSGKIRKFLLKS